VGKLGLVELRGVGSARKCAPNKIEQYSCGVERIVTEGNPFCFKGTVSGKLCFLKIDAGSDVSILSRKLVGFSKRRLSLGNNFPKYPTDEKVAVQFRVSAEIVIGKFSLEFPFLVAEISDDCILGVDFLKRVNLIKILEP